MPDLLKQLNWVDAVFLLLYVGMVYRGARTGVGAQLLSLAGWVAILYLSGRYFSFLSEAIFGFMLQDWAKPLSFLSVAAAGFLVLKFTERVFSVVLGSELSVIEKVGGTIVATLKSFVFFGMIGFFLILTPVDYLWYSAAKASRTCSSLMKFDTVVYRAIDGLFVSGDDKISYVGPLDALLNEKRTYEIKKEEK